VAAIGDCGHDFSHDRRHDRRHANRQFAARAVGCFILAD